MVLFSELLNNTKKSFAKIQVSKCFLSVSSARRDGQHSKQFFPWTKSSTCRSACKESPDLPCLKTGLPHLPNTSWSEDGVPVLRPGRSEDGAGSKDGASTQIIIFNKKSTYFILIYFYIFKSNK